MNRDAIKYGLAGFCLGLSIVMASCAVGSTRDGSAVLGFPVGEDGTVQSGGVVEAIGGVLQLIPGGEVALAVAGALGIGAPVLASHYRAKAKSKREIDAAYDEAAELERKRAEVERLRADAEYYAGRADAVGPVRTAKEAGV